MTQKTPQLYFLPLRDDVVEASKNAVLKSETQGYTPPADGAPGAPQIRLQVVDLETAKAVVKKIQAYHKMRKKFKFSHGSKGTGTSIHRESTDRWLARPTKMEYFVCVHYDDYLPSEFWELVESINSTSLHFLPVSASVISSMTLFVAIYEPLEVIRLDVSKEEWESNWFNEHAIIVNHHSLLSFARLVVANALTHKPVRISIAGIVKKLVVSVNGEVVDLSLKEIRGVAALAQLNYSHWFSVDEFCKLAFPNDSYEPRKQFDASLSGLKRFLPFGWDADEGLRRIKGAVIKSEVDKAVLHAHLSQKKVV